MNRTGLIIALAVAIVTGVAFGLYPDLDLRVARHFYAVEDASHNMFAFRIYPPVMMARNLGLWVGTVLVVPAVLALLVKLILPRRKLFIPGRAVVFLISTMILAPGLLVNVLLKDHWGRPRPIDVTQFGGQDQLCCVVGSARQLPVQLCICVRRRVWRILDGRTGSIGATAVARSRIRRSARARDRYGGDSCDGRCPFPVRRHLRGRVYVSCYLGRLRPDLPVAAHAPVG